MPDSNPNLNGKTPPYGYETPRQRKSGNQTQTQNVTVNVAPTPPPQSSRSERLLSRMAEPKTASTALITILLSVVLYHYRVEIISKLAELTTTTQETEEK